MTRKEALDIFLGNIHNGQPVDIEAAERVADGLMEILHSGNKKALNVFGLEPFEQKKTLNDFRKKRSVGRPGVGIWGRALKDLHDRETKYLPVYNRIVKLLDRRPGMKPNSAFNIVAKELGVTFSFAKKAYYLCRK